MFEKTRGDLKTSLVFAEELAKAEALDPKTLLPNTIPKEIGVYLWRSKTNGEIVYVGRAIGRNGLHQRIVKGHLRSSYKKSVFKKQIAEEYKLDIGEQCVGFIKDHFYLSFRCFKREEMNIAALVEILLINEYRPKYNREWKFSNP